MTAAATSDAPTAVDCSDFLAFEEVIRRMRAIDDNIVYALNQSVPTESFVARQAAATATSGGSSSRHPATERCRDLHQQLLSSYEARDRLIKQCVRQTADRVQELSERANGGDAVAGRRLRSEQTHLRLLRKELNVEQVIQERSNKIFHEKCRSFYRPPAAAAASGL